MGGKSVLVRQSGLGGQDRQSTLVGHRGLNGQDRQSVLG